MTQPDQWTELERLAKAATQGEWRARTYRADQSRVSNLETVAGVILARVHEGNPRRAEANAAFFAALNPATVLELIAAARASSVGTSKKEADE